MINSINVPGLAEVLIFVLFSTYLAVRPLTRSPKGDLGQSIARVNLPVPLKVSNLRIVAFVLFITLVGLLGVMEIGYLANGLTYVEDTLAQIVLPLNTADMTYINASFVLIPYLAVVGLAIFSLTLKAEPLRKIAALSSTVLFIIELVGITTLLAVLASLVSMSVTFYQWLDTGMIVFFGFLSFLSFMQVNLALPRSVNFAFKGPGNGLAIIELLVATAVSLVVSVSLFIFLADYLSVRFPVAGVGILFSVPSIATGTYLLLFVISPKPKKGIPPFRLPAISVIMPAYNEAYIIKRTLDAIEVAARAYAGAVNVVVADDGSTDGTRDIVQACFASFQKANGMLVPCPHRGKAATLNAALRAATTEIVVRIDADVVVSDRVFVPLPAWFANPEVGMVGALDLPHPDLKAWYSYGRLFECLRAFAFERIAQMHVNGIVCVPGTFTAFRRSAALSVDGFVEGMNGEDADLTIQVARLGYRVVLDTDIVIYEDVPQTWQEFRKQRIRWLRGGTQVFARNFSFTKKNISTIMYFGLEFSISKFRAIIRPVMLFGLASVFLYFPGGYQLASKMVLLSLIGNLPLVLTLVILAFKYGYGRKLFWLVIVIPFSLAKHLAAITAMLTIPPLPIAGDRLIVPDGVLPEELAPISLEPGLPV